MHIHTRTPASDPREFPGWQMGKGDGSASKDDDCMHLGGASSPGPIVVVVFYGRGGEGLLRCEYIL